MLASPSLSRLSPPGRETYDENPVPVLEEARFSSLGRTPPSRVVEGLPSDALALSERSRSRL